MKDLQIERFASGPFGAFGRLRLGELNLYTVEKPWKDNIPRESCIPLGEYELIWRPTTTQVPPEYKGHTWYVVGGSVGFDVGHRTRVALHAGNTHKDIVGCIAPGLNLGYLNSSWAVTHSMQVLRELYHLIGPQDANLTITAAPLG